MIKKHFDLILILLGCMIIIIAVSLKLYTRYEQKKIINNYRSYILEMQNNDEAFDKEKSQTSIVNKQPEKQNKTKNKKKSTKDQKQSNNIIGILSIPKIELSVAIGEGVDKDTLKYSVGHFIETAMPGEKGNFCVIGHRSYAYGEFFNRLDEIEINDKIIVDSNGKTYQYKAKEITVVEPEEVSVLNQTEDAQITLITCTPIRIGSHRLIIKGILESKK